MFFGTFDGAFLSTNSSVFYDIWCSYFRGTFLLPQIFCFSIVVFVFSSNMFCLSDIFPIISFNICRAFPNMEKKLLCCSCPNYSTKPSEQKRKSLQLSTIMKIIIYLFFILNGSDLKKYYVQKSPRLIYIPIPENKQKKHISRIIPQFPCNSHDNNRIFSLGCENENINSGRSYENVIINISDCFFIRSSVYPGDGGVIFVSGGSYSMIVYFSMFFNCSASNGGSIYFLSSNSFLKMICANRCSCSSQFHFSYLKASQINQVEYLSLSYCSQTTSGYYPIDLDSGNQILDNTNSSMNYASQVSGIVVWAPTSFTSSYCTFSNNKASNDRCIEFFSTTGTISMSYANIVHNLSPSWGVVHVSGAGLRKMMYCIFINNQNYLFCVYGGSLEVSHSFIDHISSSFSCSTSVSMTTNNTFTSIITYQIQFFNSHYCNADIHSSMPFISIEPTHHFTSFQSFEGQSPVQTLFTEHTPHQSLFPVHTPFQTHHPERTNERSFPLDYFERTPSSNNINELNTLFMYSTGGMFLIIVVMISFIIGCQRNGNKNSMSMSSSIEMNQSHKREKNTKNEMNESNDNESMRDRKMNHHEEYVSSPYVF